MKTPVLARDSLKSGSNSFPITIGRKKKPPKNKMFCVLYDFILYAVIPIAFEMSFVKIFQRSMEAYQVNDVVAMGRLIAYFAIQWFLGILVRRDYLKTTLKRVTLALLILIQVKEAFFEEVLFDMMLSMILESGFAWLLFLKFAQLMVILKFMGICLVILGVAMYINEYQVLKELKMFLYKLTINLVNYTHRIQYCMRMKAWYRNIYCYRSHRFKLA